STCARNTDRRRASSHQRGYTQAWARYSARRLSLHPFCVLCGKRAQVTDHIVPARQAPEKFWNPKNHRSLCVRCNALAAVAADRAVDVDTKITGAATPRNRLGVQFSVGHNSEGPAIG